MRGRTLGLLVLGTALALWSFATRAQLIDSDPCRSGCYEAYDNCIDACTVEDSPIACGQTCQDRLDGCLEECG